MKFFSPFLLLSIIGFLTSCSERPKTPSIASPSQLNLYVQADLISTDPRIGYDRRSIQVIRELFEGLVRIGENGAPELGVASSYALSEDKTVYTFHLNPAKWSNGLDLTAYDFEYAWKSILNHSIPTTGAYALFIIKNARAANRGECSIEEVGVRALNPSTLEVTLEHPAPFFFEFLTLPIYSPVCKVVAEKNPQWASNTFPDYVCNGPYILKERKIKSHITLERNSQYKGDKPAKTDRLHFAIIEDPQTAYNMFQEGSLDWYGDTCGNMTLEMVYELNHKGTLIKKESGGAQWLPIRTTVPHLSSQKIRQALSCAINRQELCETLLQGGETPSYSLVHKTMSHLEDHPFSYNPEKARKLFAEGMSELGYTIETYPPILLTHFSDPTVKAIVEVEQEQIQNTLGIKIELLPTDWGTFMKKFTTGDFEMLSLFWFTWYQDPTYNLEYVKFKNLTLNGTGWEKPEFIALLNNADECVDTEKRTELLGQAESILSIEMPVIPVFYHTFKYVKAPKLTGEALSPSGQMELRWLQKG